jgi:hypothetical protein
MIFIFSWKQEASQETRSPLVLLKRNGPICFTLSTMCAFSTGFNIPLCGFTPFSWQIDIMARPSHHPCWVCGSNHVMTFHRFSITGKGLFYAIYKPLISKVTFLGCGLLDSLSGRAPKRRGEREGEQTAEIETDGYNFYFFVRAPEQFECLSIYVRCFMRLARARTRDLLHPHKCKYRRHCTQV